MQIRKPFVVEALEARQLLSVSVTTYHNDAASTGANLNETVLTPANVQVATFGKLLSIPVDGQIYAQPLVVPGLTINGASHDVVFVATEHDSVYAIDSNSGAVLWQQSFINPAAGVTTPSTTDVSSTDITPEIGITGTPVIDPSTNTMYVVALTKEIIGTNTHFIYRLHALDIATGNEKFGGPAVIADTISNSPGRYTYVSGPSVAGTGTGSVNGLLSFSALRERQRVAATLINGVIYFAFSSYGDTGPFHGWLLGFNATSLQPTAVFCSTPNGDDGGIWGGGSKIASDPQGYLYIETGNGILDSTFTAAGLPSNGDYGDSVLKLAIDPTSTPSNPNINGWGIKVADFFSPFNQAGLNSGDTDLGSGSVLVLPDSVGSSAHPHLMVAGGKEGRLYLIDRDNMGHYDPATDHVVQELPGAISGDLSTPAYFNGQIYLAGGYSSDVGHSFGISNGVLTSSSLHTTPDKFSFPGSTPSVSANGTSNGIIWDLDRATGQLRAYLASNYNTEIYTSAQAANNRDQLGTGVKFAVPTVANGKVFAGSAGALVEYGLLSSPVTIPADPTNLTATAASTQITLNWTRNSTNEDGFLIEESVGGSAFTQVAGASVGSTSAIIAGLQPLTTYSFQVRAYNSVGDSKYTNVAVATTGTNPQAGVLDFSSGFATAATYLTFNGPHAQVVNTRLRLTDGIAGESASVFSTSSLDITKFNSIFNFQLTNPIGDGFTFTIQGQGPTALGTGAGGLGYSINPDNGAGNAIHKSIAIKFDLYNNAGEGSNSTGLYLNGAAPTLPSTDLSSTGINLHSGDIINANVAYDGTTLSVNLTDTVTGGTASESYVVNIPQQVGSNNGYVGFTAGTGGSTAIQDIVTWTYTPASAVQPAVPSNFTATVNSGTQVTLNWSEVPATASAFLLEKSISGGPFNQIAALLANTTSYIDTGLNPGSTYAYRVRAQNAPLVSDYAPTQTVVMPVPPVTATGAHTTFISTSEIDLAWTNNATNATGIRIYRQLTPTGQFIVAAVLTPDMTTFQDTGLPIGTQVDYHIQEFNLAGYSDFTGVNTSTLTAAPTALTATQSGSTNTLNWTAPAGAVTYNVYRGSSPGAEGTTPYATGITATTFADVGVNTSIPYYYTVTSVDAGGESAASNEASVAAAPTLPAPWVSADIGSPSPSGSASFTGQTYTLQGGGTDIWNASDQFQFTYQALTGDGTIIAHVASLSQTNQWTKAGIMIRESLAPTARDVSLVQTASHGVRLQFRNTTGATTAETVPTTNLTWFELVRSGGTVSAFQSSNGVTWIPIGSPQPIATGTVYVGLALTSHLSGTLATATFDNVSVAASATSLPVNPSNLNAAGTAGSPVTLTWSDNSTNESGFKIDRATNATFTQGLTTTLVGAAVTTYTDNSTVAGTTYFYRVRATNSLGDSINSNIVSPVAATVALPTGWSASDVGAPTAVGNATYVASTGTYTLTGGGADIWSVADQFQYAYQSLAGDGTIIAHVASLQNTSDWAKAGVMIRQSLAANSPYSMMMLTQGHGVRLQSRTSTGTSATEVSANVPVTPSYWLKLVRAGGFITGYASPDNITWTQVGSPIAMATGTIYIGLAVTSHNTATVAAATFDHLSITSP